MQDLQRMVKEVADALQEHTRLVLPSGAFARDADPMHRRLKLVVIGVSEVK